MPKHEKFALFFSFLVQKISKILFLLLTILLLLFFILEKSPRDRDFVFPTFRPCHVPINHCSALHVSPLEKGAQSVCLSHWIPENLSEEEEADRKVQFFSEIETAP